eukprot:1038869-Lingulodinium_polyedra.AAC.1
MVPQDQGVYSASDCGAYVVSQAFLDLLPELKGHTLARAPVPQASVRGTIVRSLSSETGVCGPRWP